MLERASVKGLCADPKQLLRIIHGEVFHADRPFFLC